MCTCDLLLVTRIYRMPIILIVSTKLNITNSEKNGVISGVGPCVGAPVAPFSLVNVARSCGSQWCRPGAGLVVFKGIQLNTQNFWQKIPNIKCIHAYNGLRCQLTPSHTNGSLEVHADMQYCSSCRPNPPATTHVARKNHRRVPLARTFSPNRWSLEHHLLCGVIYGKY
jgi:hypothetical protein